MQNYTQRVSLPPILANIFPITQPSRLGSQVSSMKNSCCTCQHLRGLVISALNAAFVHAVPPCAEQHSWAPALPLQVNILQAKEAGTGLQQALAEEVQSAASLYLLRNHLVLPWRGVDKGLFADECLLAVLLVAGPDTAAGAFPCSIRSLHGKITLLVQVTATSPWHYPA